jgi:hypothetical protein
LIKSVDVLIKIASHIVLSCIGSTLEPFIL